MISNEELRQKVAEMLKQAGINAAEVATSPVALERAAKTVTGLLPFVLRPLVKERIRGVILQIAERVPRPAGTEPSLTAAEPVEVRLRSVQDEIRRTFGDDYATKRSLRGYDAETDVQCGRLTKECEALETAVSQSDTALLVRVVLAKAHLLGNWQRLHGSKSNQQSAIECYERALTLADGVPDLQGEIHYQFGRFCAGADEEVSGGKRRAIEQFQRAMAASAPGTATYIGCEQELQKLQKKRWFA
jgi:tetratricopeptide (TPR) repeat protein